MKAFAFDIDGVLLRGGRVLPQAKKALNLLKYKNIPFILLTNGGGTHEKDRVKELSEKLDTEIYLNQFLQSHTPFKDFTKNHKNILAVGGRQDKVLKIAMDYGFKNVIVPSMVYKAIKHYHAFPCFTQTQVHDLTPEFNVEQPIDGIFVFHDTFDMSFDTQLISDLLVSENGVLGTRKSHFSSTPSVPIHFSNADLQWATDYNLPRFGQGALINSISALYTSLTNHKLNHTTIGKPTKLTYLYAEKLLNDFANKPINEIYMVGDNQFSDILGANNFGWKSILLRSGVYKDGDEMVSRPTVICDDVLKGVEWALNE